MRKLWPPFLHLMFVLKRKLFYESSKYIKPARLILVKGHRTKLENISKKSTFILSRAWKHKNEKNE